MITRLRTPLQAAPEKNLASLIHGCVKQDRESQHLIYSRYFGFGLKIVFRYMGDYSAAVQLTNETMVEIFRSFSGFKVFEHLSLERSLDRWMKDAFIQAIVRWSRSRDWSEVPAAVPVQTDANIWVPANAEGAADAQLYRNLMTRLLSLPLAHRLVFNLSVIDGYSIGEVARLSGLRERRVEHYYLEARTKLRDSTLFE